MDKFSKKEGSKIAELIEKGREQGFLTYDDVNDHLPDDISDPDQVEEIIGVINNHIIMEAAETKTIDITCGHKLKKIQQNPPY